MRRLLSAALSPRGVTVLRWIARAAVALVVVLAVFALARVNGIASDLRGDRAAACQREDITRGEVAASNETLRNIVIRVVRGAPSVSQMTFDQRLLHEELKKAVNTLAEANSRLARLSCDPPSPKEPA